jgi:peptidoglycan hydrolase-like protein with peptidoglycan-binding domain
MLDWLTYDGLTRQEFSLRLGWIRLPSCIVLHSTEVDAWPGYAGGGKAPHFTIDPRARAARQHFPLTSAARALVAPPDGTHTNTGGAIQIEIIGTCDPRNTGMRSVLDFDDGDLAYLAGLLRAISDATGIPLASTVTWLPYPASYGATAVRLTPAQWGTYMGVLGHQHVPGNVHGDPGTLNIGRLLELAGGAATVSNPIPAPTPAAPAPAAEPTGLTVDGLWGNQTDLALQRVLGVTADGIVGPVTRKALQRALGVTADGIWGPVTRKALQARLGVTRDGIWGPVTIKALQTRLNTGAL